MSSNDIAAALKSLSLHGMGYAWPEVLGTTRIKSMDHEALMHQLLKAERAYRDVRSMAYQMRVARFPYHRDLVGFDFAQAQVNEALVAIAAARAEDVPLFHRHWQGEWGDIPEQDWLQNEMALLLKFRVWSSYRPSTGKAIWIITVANRTITTITLADS